MSSDSQNQIFEYCLGGFALFSTLVSIIRFFQSLLPSRNIVTLNELLDETKGIYQDAVTERLFPSSESHRHARVILGKLQADAASLRERTYKSQGVYDEVVALFQGLTQDISALIDKARTFRGVLLSTTQERRRLKREAEEASLSTSFTPRVSLDLTATENSERLDSTETDISDGLDTIPADITTPSLDTPSRSNTLVDEESLLSAEPRRSLLSWLWQKLTFTSSQGSAEATKVTSEPTSVPSLPSGSTCSV